MFLQLTQDQIAKRVDIVKQTIDEASPPTTVDAPDRSVMVLADVLSGQKQVWVSFENTEQEETPIVACAITAIVDDEVNHCRALLLFAVKSFSRISDHLWAEGIRSLTLYAKAQECRKITAFSNSRKVIQTLQGMGWNTEFMFLSYDLTKG